MREERTREYMETISIEEYLMKRNKLQAEGIDQNSVQCYDTQMEEFIQRR